MSAKNRGVEGATPRFQSTSPGNGGCIGHVFFLDISGAQVLSNRNRRTFLDLIENGDRWVGNPPKVNPPLCYMIYDGGQKQEEFLAKITKDL